MPVIPMVRQKDWGGARIPTVMSADAAPLARGGRSLARGISGMGRAAAGCVSWQRGPPTGDRPAF